MRRNALGFSGAVTLAAISLGCSDSPTEPAHQPEVVRFTLSDVEAAALASALDDVGSRILPSFPADPSLALAWLIGEVSAAIDARDAVALRAALKRTEAVLTALTANDLDSALAPELDAVRLILDQARPLANPETRQ